MHLKCTSKPKWVKLVRTAAKSIFTEVTWSTNCKNTFFAALGIHSNSLGWLEQNLICNNQLVARGAWNYVGALVLHFAMYFLVNQVSFKFIFGLQTYSTANFLLKITLWGERQLNINQENMVFLLASCARMRIIQGVLLLWVKWDGRNFCRWMTLLSKVSVWDI